MSRLLHAAASLRLTVPGIALLAAGSIASYRTVDAPAWWLLLPLGGLALNLAAALLSHPRFRQGTGLLVFHLGLLAVLVLALAGELTKLSARIEIAEGQALADADLQIDAAGPLHSMERLAALDLAQADFRVEYAAGLARGATRSTLVAAVDGAPPRAFRIGDARPLVIDGYRFYTTSNKGFAAVLTWLGDDGVHHSGAVHLPSYPLNDWKQVNRWRTPGGETLGLELTLPDLRVETDSPWTLHSGAARGRSSLRVTRDGRARDLAPGQRVRVGSGWLRYERPAAWMGYRVVHQPLLPWLLAAGLVGVLGLAWHVLGAPRAAAATDRRRIEDAAASRT